MKKKLVLMTIALIVVFTGSLCYGQTKGQIVFCQGGELNSLDPARQVSTPDSNVGIQIFDSLYYWNNKGEPSPRLALSHKLVNDTTWEFKLRKGVKFHDGSPFTAKDVKFSIERMADPQTKAGFLSFYNTIKEVKIINEDTVQILTKTPDPLLLKRLCLLMYILPSDLVQKQGADTFFQKPIGSGPWKFVSWSRNDRLILEANTSYWGGAPKQSGLVFRPVPEVSARIAELQTGNADIITSIPPFLLARLKSAPNVTVHPMQTGRAMWVYINAMKDGPLKNKKVRQAMNYAIDKESITKNILLGSAAPCAVGITPLHFGYDPSLKPYPYDPAKAKKLLSEAGYPNGFKVEFNTPNGKYLMDKEISEAIAKMLNAVGIQTDLKVLEWATHMQIIIGQRLQGLALSGFANLLSDADATLSLFYTPGSASSYFNSPSLTDKINKARSTMDSKKRLTLYKQIQAELYDEAPMIYLYQQLDNYGTSKTLKGVEIWDEGFTFKNVTK